MMLIAILVWYLSQMGTYSIIMWVVDQVCLYALVHQLYEALLPLLMLPQAAILLCLMLSCLRSLRRWAKLHPIDGYVLS